MRLVRSDSRPSPSFLFHSPTVGKEVAKAFWSPCPLWWEHVNDSLDSRRVKTLSIPVFARTSHSVLKSTVHLY